METSKVRCAVIGLGMGKGHAKAYNECEDAELVAVADLDAERLALWTDTVGATNCFTDYKEMLKAVKPDLVSVALPNFLHAPVAIDCFEAGCHVLGEKPMAKTIEEALRIRDAADKAGKRFGINLSYRFTPPARALKDLSDAGVLGTPYHAYTKWTRRDGFPGFGGWFGQKELSGGGPLIDLGVHRIDLALWLMQGPSPKTVSGAAHMQIGAPRAKAQGKTFDVEDFATGFVRFEGGESLVFEVSWGNHQQARESQHTQVIGTEGALVHTNNDHGYSFEAKYYSNKEGHFVDSLVTPHGKELRNPYHEMVAAVKEDRDFLATAADGIRIQQILDGLYRSAEAGHEVDVTVD